MNQRWGLIIVLVFISLIIARLNIYRNFNILWTLIQCYIFCKRPNDLTSAASQEHVYPASSYLLSTCCQQSNNIVNYVDIK